ncbi:MAG: hypothetical protein U9Q06_02140 [Nanoarchaeota archaeon]|nr:hypothetical protein [Nanoarchaeota archaeon]
MKTGIDVYERRKAILGETSPDVLFRDDSEQTRETKRKTGFEYLCLGDTDITPCYRPHPGSNPKEAYVAKLGVIQTEDDGEIKIVEAVYRLITQTNNRVFPTRKEFALRKSDRKNRVIRVTKGAVFDSMLKLYDDRVEKETEHPAIGVERFDGYDEAWMSREQSDVGLS